MTGETVISGMLPMHDRSNGLGGGFAGYGIYPEYNHIRDVLIKDGATDMFVGPDPVTGVPFWKAMGFTDSGKIDPDDKSRFTYCII